MTEGEEIVLFMRHLGAALAAWSNVENSVRNCLIACFVESERNALSLGYFSIENFRSKLDFANSVIGKKLGNSPLAREWAALFSRTRSASTNRNALAHRSTRHYPNCKPGRRLVLSPWIFPKPKHKTSKPMPPAGSLGLLDVVKYALEFHALTASLMNFCHRVLGVPEQYSKSDEQPMRPPTIQTLVLQIHEELGHPGYAQKSSRLKS